VIPRTSNRWYPTLEPLEDGRIIIIGGNKWGGFINDANNSNPTYEYYPRDNNADPLPMSLLERTLPANLYPITHLLPTRKLIINLNNNATVYDHVENKEYPLPNVPYAVRTYPASAANFMWPLTVKDKWLATVMYCGGCVKSCRAEIVI
jgi:Glyoxal oxidase N-terminus